MSSERARRFSYLIDPASDSAVIVDNGADECLIVNEAEAKELLLILTRWLQACCAEREDRCGNDTEIIW